MDKDLKLEKEYLDKVLDFVRGELDAASKKKQSSGRELIETRKEMWQNSVAYYEDADRRMEQSQYLEMLKVQTSSYDVTARRVSVLEHMLSKPYFGRIDYRESGLGDELLYIGISNLLDMQSLKMLVHDWRAPVCGLFYSAGLGEVSYEAPEGKITAELIAKRQYKIENGTLDTIYDVSIGVTDNILLEALSNNAGRRMKNIVETIQRDQNEIIRESKTDLLLVQGAAGSGKSSVALHRAAYLLYAGQKNRLDKRHLLVISPNGFFSEYISEVLPSLGEDNIRTLSFEGLCENIFKPKGFRVRSGFDELEDFLNGRDRASASFTKAELDEIILANADNETPIDERLISLFAQKGLLRHGNRISQKNYLALVYLKLKIAEDNPFRGIRHVIIDEAQDYSQAQMELIRLVFRSAKLTMLGDVNQAIGGGISFEEIAEIFNKRALFVKLNKSFRCTKEILEFAQAILPPTTPVESFNRSGKPPLVSGYSDIKEIAAIAIETSRRFKSVCLLCKTMRLAKQLYNRLSPILPNLRLVDEDDAGGIGGIMLMPVYLAKGVEFDAVIIADADAIAYSTELDRKILYVAATRALHELYVCYNSELGLSPLLG